MDKRPLAICGVLSGLGPGGSERVMATLASRWALDGHDVTLITLADAESDFFVLPAGVKRLGLGRATGSSWPGKAIVSNSGRIRRLRSAIRSARPDVIVSFGDRTNVLTILAGVGSRTPVIVSERTNPATGALGIFWRGLRRITYPRAAGLVAQTEAAGKWAVRIADAERVTVIPNPLDARFQAESRGTDRLPQIVAMGRFGREKGFDILIQAFHTSSAAHPTWRLALFGDGPEEDDLRSIADSGSARDRIEFHSTVLDPETELDRASVFVLPSRFEGFPNVLVEAMARGCAIVAADCPWGPNEIVTNGIDGLLIPPEDPAALALSLSSLMEDESARARLGKAAQKVRTRFEAGRVAAKWVYLMHSLAGSREE